MRSDFLIIGAGIAGASAGYFLASRARVLVLERESQPGYHTTGRSAALFAESYGTPQVRALTAASRAFFERPPGGFAAGPVLSGRGALFVGDAGQVPALDALHAALQGVCTGGRRLSPDEALARVPVLARERLAGGVLDPLAADMDVHTLHQGYLRGLRDRGGEVLCNVDAQVIERTRGLWRARVDGEVFEAPVLVNAAGAWCDVVARRAGVVPLGLVPKRRSAFTFRAPEGVDFGDWPAVIGVDESFYFKPDAGQLMGSPANADPVEPHDVQAEEEDVATGILRIEQATTLRIRRPSHTWAGLRSFVGDGDLVGGFDPRAEGFFWCAAQGGYGIQTSAAMGEVCAALALGQPVPERIRDFGVTAAMLAPDRDTLNGKET
ncbi:MAG: FAD-dependent oxidoreductase [Betaproteobacteria bacterium]|nr:FAD-dependent oxidoreductase [Betaproteobacteria bacterium]